jgi:homoserine kinase
MVKRADAVTNLQHASLLVSAIYERNEDLLKESLADRLHEPYRAQLVEELPALQKLLKTSPALGCVLSGAGSSVMVLVNEKHRLEVIERIQHWIDRTAVRPSLFDVGADHLGLEELDL